MAVPPEEVGQADFSLPAIAVGMEIHLLVFDRPPKPFDEDVVVTTPLSRPTDLDRRLPQPAHED